MKLPSKLFAFVTFGKSKTLDKERERYDTLANEVYIKSLSDSKEYLETRLRERDAARPPLPQKEVPHHRRQLPKLPSPSIIVDNSLSKPLPVKEKVLSAIPPAGPPPLPKRRLPSRPLPKRTLPSRPVMATPSLPKRALPRRPLAAPPSLPITPKTNKLIIKERVKKYGHFLDKSSAGKVRALGAVPAPPRNLTYKKQRCLKNKLKRRRVELSKDLRTSLSFMPDAKPMPPYSVVLHASGKIDGDLARVGEFTGRYMEYEELFRAKKQRKKNKRKKKLRKKLREGNFALCEIRNRKIHNFGFTDGFELEFIKKIDS